jgi:hypothetical protein
MNEYVMDLQLYVEGLCHGNLSENEAVKLSEIFTSTLSAKPLSDELKSTLYLLTALIDEAYFDRLR